MEQKERGIFLGRNCPFCWEVPFRWIPKSCLQGLLYSTVTPLQFEGRCPRLHREVEVWGWVGHRSAQPGHPFCETQMRSILLRHFGKGSQNEGGGKVS